MLKHIVKQFYQPRITWNQELYIQNFSNNNIKTLLQLPVAVNVIPKYITPDYLNKYVEEKSN